MLLQIVKRDFQRNKIITLVLFIFILLSALLMAAASRMIMELSGSLNHLLAQSKAPHYVQMHAGPLDRETVQRFVSEQPLIADQQTVEMLGIDGSHLFLGPSGQSEENSVMDIGFVRQNPSFDLLLNLENQVIQVAAGEIAVPIYYMQQHHLKIGDPVRIASGTFEQEFTIAHFVRDVQMNPSIVSSKRFVVNDDDFRTLQGNLGEIEYLLEFQLTDLSRLSEFSNAYQASDMPNKGPAIDYSLFKTLNALTDGIIAIVIILVSFLLMLIAVLCLRFTMIATMEEDYREIGVMKAIGIPQQEIKRIYLAKYTVIAALSSLGGYLISLAVMRLFTANISLYLGAAPNSWLKHTVPVLAVCLIIGMVILFCRMILRRLSRISAVEALRSGTVHEKHSGARWLKLDKRKYMKVNTFLGLKDLMARISTFTLLLFVYVICVFIVIVPVNLLNTLQSPGFVAYMGVGQSDIRIDLQQSKDTEQRFERLTAAIDNDPEIKRYSPLITSRFKVLGGDGVWENLNVESGDFSIFPLSYTSGAAPGTNNELALSDLNARELNKKVGDTLVLLVGGAEKEMKVSGIYQDITNGGRTAKAQLPHDPNSVLWYVVALDVLPGVSLQAKMDQYADAFYPAKITHLQSYLSQTLGNTISQLKLVTLLAAGIGLSISILITSLFLKMQLAKDSPQMAIMRSLGFTRQDIRMQYLVRLLLISVAGILFGILSAGTIGQSLVGLLGSFMGASRIQLVVNPAAAYLLLPAALLLVVTVTTLVSSRSRGTSNITKQIVA
ncbi:ABC transporter permease [Paenibacillus albidus]|uniref:ABC transporter permease n=1 Tax=Paenibacillus albidus TaxID=2041023 RepID=UPI001BE81DE9|nr:ABC transporter permease [Paenibacillus albidus]MBT2292939.1 ABC transporter permease [Paenibacillus albidus]